MLISYICIYMYIYSQYFVVLYSVSHSILKYISYIVAIHFKVVGFWGVNVLYYNAVLSTYVKVLWTTCINCFNEED